MAYNYGKKFEDVVRGAFEKVPGVSIDRLHDQTTGWKGSTNICDFIVYREPYEYYFECKSVHGNTLPFSNITETQWNGLLEKSKIEGVFAGIICWFVNKNDTRFFPIQYLQKYKQLGCKSVAAFASVIGTILGVLLAVGLFFVLPAITSITSSVKSFGCGETNLIISIPSILSTSLKRFENSKRIT